MTLADIGLLVLLGVGVLALVVGVAYLSRLVKQGGQPTQGGIEKFLQIVSVLESVIKNLVGEKWEPVYDCAVKALNAVADGDYTRTEALATAKDVFETAIGFTDVTLDVSQKEFLYEVFEKLIELIIKEPDVAGQALSLSARLK